LTELTGKGSAARGRKKGNGERKAVTKRWESCGMNPVGSRVKRNSKTTTTSVEG